MLKLEGGDNKILKYPRAMLKWSEKIRMVDLCSPGPECIEEFQLVRQLIYLAGECGAGAELFRLRQLT